MIRSHCEWQVYRERRSHVARRARPATRGGEPVRPAALAPGPDAYDATMPEPVSFFNDYPRFLETSTMRGSFERLNARYTMLIDRHRRLLDGGDRARPRQPRRPVHARRARAGARHVVGVEIDDVLVARANANMAAYGVEPASYEFVTRDMFRHFDELDEFDVVFCFGILYHINDHMQLLSNIAGRATEVDASSIRRSLSSKAR